MKRSPFSACLLFVCGLGLPQLLAGCGSNQGCVQYAQAICARAVQCAASLAKYESANIQECQSIFAQDCQLSTQAPDSNFTQSAANDCATALSGASCDIILAGPWPDACRPPGNRSVGAGCGDDFQCQSLRCDRASPHDCGTCGALPTEGMACRSDGRCADGLNCGGSGMCTAAKGLGETCDQNYFCKPTLACSNGTCQMPAVGAACAGANDYCNGSALQFCDINSFSCQPRNYTVSKLGDSCGIDYLNAIIIDCEPGAYCKTGSSESIGVCTRLPHEGEACATITSSSGITTLLCLAPSTCVSGTCQIFDRGSCK